jgi:hypothetical protein
MRSGTRNPKAVMLSAIWRICFFECILALRALGVSASTAIHSSVGGMSLSFDTEAKRARASTCVVKTKLC